MIEHELKRRIENAKRELEAAQKELDRLNNPLREVEDYCEQHEIIHNWTENKAYLEKCKDNSCVFVPMPNANNVWEMAGYKFIIDFCKTFEKYHPYVCYNRRKETAGGGRDVCIVLNVNKCRCP